MTSLALAMAPLASALCQRYEFAAVCEMNRFYSEFILVRWNCRYVTMAGGLICASGIAMSSLAPNLECLFLTLGVVTGVGIGFCTTPGIILTSRYFSRHRAKANAFCLSGTAAGSFTLPHLIQYLVCEFGFRGAVLILGACMLHICISAALFRPLAVHVRITRTKQQQPSPIAPDDVETILQPPPSAEETAVAPCSSNRFVHPMVSVDVEYHENPDDMIAALR
jgi:MFS family permease